MTVSCARTVSAAQVLRRLRRLAIAVLARLPGPLQRLVRSLAAPARRQPGGGSPTDRTAAVPAQLAPRAAMHEPAPSLAGAGVRLGLVGRPPAWFTGWARTADVEPAWAGAFVERLGSQVDAVMIDGAVIAGEPDRAARIAAEARATDARVIAFTDGAGGLAGFADLEIRDGVGTAPRAAGGARTRLLTPPVDVRVVNPVGFRPRTDGPVGLVIDEPDNPDALSAARRLVVDVRDRTGVAVEVFSPDAHARAAVPGASFSVLPDDPAGRTTALRRCRGFVDAPGLHRDAVRHAHRLIRFTAAGMLPWTGTLPQAVRGLVGAPLADTLEAIDHATFDDAYRAERTSVALRRLALRHHSRETRWAEIAGMIGLPSPPRPSVSAVMSTNRPEHLLHAVRQMSAQDHDDLELVVVLHGVEVGDAERRAAQAASAIPLEILELSSSATLGDALNVAVRASGGAVVTKVDDDDWYGRSHVSDLLCALEYSGAQVVGKAAEFIYLGALDATIRRFAGKAERIDRNLAGGTLAMWRHDLEALGGWRRVRRAVDQRLLDDVIGGGGLPYRTHGFGFMLNRHGEGHTWDLGVDYFLRQASQQQRGIARGLAWIDTGEAAASSTEAVA